MKQKIYTSFPIKNILFYLSFIFTLLVFSQQAYGQCGQFNTTGTIISCINCTVDNGSAVGSLGGDMDLSVTATDCGSVSVLVEYAFDWNQGPNLNWIHGISFGAGPNWTATQAGAPANWVFMPNGLNGLCSGNAFGAGFFFEGAAVSSFGIGLGACSCNFTFSELSNTNPSDNWGVDCTTGCPTFTFELVFCPPDINTTNFTENIGFTVSEDGASGGWCLDGDCVETNNFSITINNACGENPDFDFDDYCEGEPNGPSNVSSPGGTFVFSPSPGGGVSIDPTTGEITGGVAGETYTVQYTTPGTCTITSATETVTVLASTVVDLGPDIVQCEGAGTITIGVVDDGISTYQWSGGSTATTSMITIPDASLPQTTYTLTVTSGSCEGSDDIDITIEPSINPTFTINDTYCQNETTDPLPATSDNGINGTWSPTTIDNNADGTYTFTPAAGQCAEEVVLNVTISTSIAPTFTINDTYCQNETTDPLPATSDNGINGTWSPTTIDNNADGTYTFTPAAGQCAEEVVLNVTISTSTTPSFTLTDTYCQNETTDPLPTTSDNGINGTWSPTTIDDNADGTYTFTPAAGQCAEEVVLNVTISTSTTPSFTLTDTYCQNETTDPLPATSDNGINGTWSPTTIDNNADGTYTFTPAAGQCAEEVVLNVTISTSTTPSFTLTDTYCQNETTDPLPATSDNGINGTWSPTTIDNNADGTYTFTPAAGQCAEEVVLNVTIEALTVPTFTINDTYCQNETTDPLPATSDNGINGTWSPTTIDNNADGTYTFTPAAGQCAEEVVLNVTIEALTVPTFTINDTYCQNETTDPFPATSDNGINGTWSPTTIDNNADGTYTFTPAAGQCAEEVVLNVTISTSIAPTFTINDTYCQNETTDPLPTTSDNGINGTWSPTTIDNNADGTYTFTPAAGQCAEEVVLNVTIEALTVPTFTINDTYCQNEITDPLPATSDNGINGTWSPTTIDNNADGTYTFTPAAGQCAEEVVLNVTIEALTVPTFTINDTYCQNEITDPLPATSDNGINGTWSPTTIDNNADGTYTFTPAAGQCAEEVVLNVTISAPTDPIFILIDTYCVGDVGVDALPTISDNGINGTWSPAVISTVIAGDINYTFTPNVGCFNPLIFSITINDCGCTNPATIDEPSGGFTICAGETASLSAILGGSATSLTWTTTGDGFFNDSNDINPIYTPGSGDIASGLIFLTVTTDDPDGTGPCLPHSDEVIINIDIPLDPIFSINDTYCEEESTDPLPTTSDNGINGMWSPTAIDNNADGTYTFTPAAGQCAEEFVLNVTIEIPTDPIFILIDTYCVGDVGVDALPTISDNGINGTWSPAVISTVIAGDINYTFTPNAGCFNPLIFSITINDCGCTNPATVDELSGGFTICAGETASLSAILGGSATSLTWTTTGDGFFNDSNDINPIYTPGSGDIASGLIFLTVTTDDPDGTGPCLPHSDEVIINIDIPLDPIFSINDTYCEEESTDPLPTTSDNGINGMWSPTAIDNNADGAYTFSPNADECANDFTLNVTIETPTNPMFTLIENYCQGDITDILPTIANNGINGTWSPTVIDNSANGIYTFSPNADECANDFILNVTIETPTNPMFTLTEIYCVGDTGDLLPTTSDNGITGTWSPSSINTTGAGNTTYTFNPDVGCFNSFNLSVTINDCGCMTPAIVMATPNFAICAGETAALSATLNGSATTLTWTTVGDGSFDDLAATNPIYTPGANDVSNGSVIVTVLTDDPDGSGPCSPASDDVIITINAPTNPTFTLTNNYCQDETTDVLPTNSNNGIAGTWVPNAIDNSASGTYTFSPNAGQCANGFTLEVTINTPTDPTFSLINAYCLDEVAETLPTTSTNGATGTWLPNTINTSASGNTNYTFTPDAGCFNDFIISIMINDCGCANPPTIIANNDLSICEGTTANLSATIGGSATSVTWATDGDGSFEDLNLTNPVYTPGVNDVMNGALTVTATTDDPDGNGPCSAVSDNIIISIDATADPTFSLTENYCEGEMTDALPTVSDNGIAGTWSPNMIDNTDGDSYIFTPNTGACANSFTLNVAIETPIDPTFSLTENYCQGEMTDALPTVSDNGIIGTWSPNMIDNTDGDSYVFTPNAGACANSFTLNVTIETPVSPIFSLTENYCINEVAELLPTISDNNISGTWNPSLINTANAGNTSYTFTPTAGCFAPFILNIAIEDCDCLNPATVIAINDFAICVDETANLSATLGGSATSLTWTTTGDGSFDNAAIANPIYTPDTSDLVVGSVIVTVTTNDPDGSDPCSASSDDVIITFNSLSNPTFNLIDNYCAGEITDDLPNTSNNGVSGTWLPEVIDNVADGTYIFTPNMGECANSFTLNVTIDAPTDPTFTLTSSYCPDETTDILPTISDNGISGTWLPDVIDNMASGMYVFTPNMNECANSFTLNVTVSNSIDPIFNLTNTYCQGEMTDALPNISANGISGTWNPNVIDNQADGNYNFTPDGCANSFTLTVTIEAPSDPTFAITDTYCVNDMVEDLPINSDNGIAGTWNPTTISTTNAGNINYIFTPTEDCVNSFNLMVVVEDCGCMNPAMISAIDDFTICADETADLSAQLGGSATMLTWSTTGDGTFDNPTVVDAVYTPGANDIANGSVTITTTTNDPDGTGPCSPTSDEVSVTISSPIASVFNLTDTYCQGEATDILPTIADNDIAGTWLPNVIASMTDADYTFTPNSDECANDFTLAVTINDAPIVSNLTEICGQNGDTYTVSFIISDGDSNSYVVTGGNGTLIDNTFTSDPILDNTPYNFMVDDINGCSPVAILGQFDCPDCPAIAFDLDITGEIACSGDANGMAMVSNISSDFPPLTFNWSNGEQIQEAENLAAGWQVVTVTDGEGCVGVDSIFLSEPITIAAQLVANDSDCFGDNNGSILFDSIIGGTPPFTYSIDGVNFSNQNQFNFLTPDTYEIAVQDANGCMFAQDISITETAQILVDLGMDSILNLGDSILLDPMITPVIIVDTFIWLGVNCINCPDVTVTPLEATTVSLTIATLNGCVGSDAIFLGVNSDVSIYLPNVFSPNGDGVNDSFYPQSGAGVEIIKAFIIFNRWGEQVFQFYNFPPNSPFYGWDGTQKGKYLNPQVCVWYAEVLLKNGQTKIVKGDVTLVR